MFELVLKYPVSANRYWRRCQGRVVRSAEANAYRRHANAVAGEAELEPLWSDVAVEIELLPKLTLSGAASGTVMDLDNSIKVALDALQGTAFHNDRQVKCIAARYGEPVKDGGLRVRIAAM